MITVKGIAVNIDRDIIGKVEMPYSGDLNLSRVKVITKGEPREVLLLVKDTQEQNKSEPIYVYNISNITSLNHGDVVLINPSGLITVVYRRVSNDNSIIVTERCNCSCLTCPQPPRICPSYLNINKQIISMANKDTPVLGLTGGEPTVVPDELIELIGFCKDKLPSTSLQLLTNGIALDNFEFVKKIISIKHPQLRFHIPLFADTDREHNQIIQTEGFYRTVKGLYNLALFNQFVEIRVVITALNWQRLGHIAEFVYRNFPFVGHVAFMGLEFIGHALKNHLVLWVDPYDTRHELRKAIQYLHRADMDVSIFNYTLCVLPTELRNFARQSISDWKTIYLDICNKCVIKEKCCGLFSSNASVHSRFMNPLVG